jgi:alanine racemase
MPTISTLHEAKQFSRVATRLDRPARVHIKVDTGMGRLGVTPAEARKLISQVNRLPHLKLEGLYTHYSSVEDDAAFSRLQRLRFEKVLNELATEGIRVPLIHANNSGALLHEPRTLFDLARPGLLVYGVVPAGRRRVDSTLAKRLRPALSFKCRVGLVKDICRGTSLSYGRTFVARRNMRVATLTAGYGDGYLRAASNRSKVLIGGRRCPVLGRVTMDQMMVDVSLVRNVRAGDETVLIGRQDDDEITASEVAAWCGTVPWEILTAISYRVPRIYRGSQAA